GLQFCADRYLATLSTLGAEGSIHVVPVGFTYDAGVARVITSGGSRKVFNARRGGVATLSQVDGARWLSLSGTVRIADDAETVADAVQRYTERYRSPRANPLRVAMIITINRVMGSSVMKTERHGGDEAGVI
ncbi:MAG: TIGR03618 family F420-dependent PPOX class oxidoreductase, partial [Rhodoglobus sp.]